MLEDVLCVKEERVIELIKKLPRPIMYRDILHVHLTQDPKAYFEGKVDSFIVGWINRLFEPVFMKRLCHSGRGGL